MQRRDFLKLASLATTTLGAGAGAMLLGERSARARNFGETPQSDADVMYPEDQRATSVLEIFLFGGLSQYESFYCVPDHGKDQGTHWHAFLDNGQIDKAMADCNFQGSPSLLQTFGQDSLGQAVSLGPFTMPLRDRADLTSRLRICMTAHDVEPHELAVPLALTGRRSGDPALAGVGAHVERYFQSVSARQAPSSYVLLTQASLLAELSRAAVATGLHQTAARPFSLKIDAKGDLVDLLKRPVLGDRSAAYDAMVQANLNRYASHLLPRSRTQAVRSGNYGDLTSATSAVSNSSVLRDILTKDLFEDIPGDACGTKVNLDRTTLNLRLAAHLLTHPTSPARHVTVVDGGLLPVKDAGGYDSHDDNTLVQSRNLVNMLRTLASLINKPGENDPTKINLDKTLIIINTEFGRTPQVERAAGRGHWPYGYPVVYLGGPIREQNAGIYGGCDPTGRATQFATPREHRVAVLVALGIWPFAQESYNVADVNGAPSEAQAVQMIKQKLLGYTG